MEKPTARLMTCHMGSENKPPEEVGGYCPIEPYEILNADETMRAVIKTINYNAKMSKSFEDSFRDEQRKNMFLERKLKSPIEWLKFIIKYKQ